MGVSRKRRKSGGAQPLTRRELSERITGFRRSEPTAAMAVLRYIEFAELNAPERRRGGQARRQHGHPARLTRADKRRAWVDPEGVLGKERAERELEVRELNRLMRDEIADAPQEDGTIVGPLAVAARHAARQLVAMHGLTDDESHLAGVELWLLGGFGDVVRSFDADDYRRWRETCIGRAEAAA